MFLLYTCALYWHSPQQIWSPLSRLLAPSVSSVWLQTCGLFGSCITDLFCLLTGLEWRWLIFLSVCVCACLADMPLSTLYINTVRSEGRTDRCSAKWPVWTDVARSLPLCNQSLLIFSSLHLTSLLPYLPSSILFCTHFLQVKQCTPNFAPLLVTRLWYQYLNGYFLHCSLGNLSFP